MLSRLLERLKGAKRVDQVVLATTVLPRDNCLAELAVGEKVPFYRGSEDNVLERYYEAAQHFEADILVRVTADCPLLDPTLIDEAVAFFQARPRDYINNLQAYPLGMSVEVFSQKSFQKVYQEAHKPEEQEHVTPYYYRHPEIFKLAFLPKKAHPGYRLTVDTPDDFTLISKIFEALYPSNPNFTLEDIYALLKEHPTWAQINAHVEQKKV